MTRFDSGIVDSLLEANKDIRERRFRLRWKGSKVPRGVMVGDIPVDWTQHGVVYGGGDVIGFYDRTVCFGGENRDEHELIVYADKQVFNQDGTACEELK